ncbi:MAG: hypothetical protein F4187_02195 [Gemmatimonadetes bacterium]|nr:hypothetical protein [Gemmatimonadota bacterium]
MKIRSRFCAAAALVTAVPPLAGELQAQQIPSSYRFIEGRQEVSILSGYMPLDAGTLELGPKTGPLFGARYAIEAVGPFFFEGLISYVPTEREVIDPRRAEDDRSIGRTDVHLVMVDASMDFSLTGRRTWNRVSPHLFVGGGLAVDLAGDGEISGELLSEDVFEFGTAFTANAGVGFRMSLTGKLMLRADAGLKLWKHNTPGGFDDPTKRPVVPGVEPKALVREEWVAGQGLSLSLGWRF